MRLPALLAIALASTVIPACATDDNSETDDTDAADDDGKADSATELSVRDGDTTLWVDKALVRTGDAFVLHARTSRTLTDARAFVFDDVYGDAVVKSARVFEVTWHVGEARGLVEGINLFTSLSFVHSSTRPDGLTARAVVRPRLGATHGSSTLALTAELTPVVEAGHTVFRIAGRSTKPIVTLAPTLGTGRLTDAQHFEIDLDFDQIMTLASPGGELAVTATFASGSSTIRAPLGLSVKKLGMTTKDVYDQYPVPTCTATTKSCLAALPDGALGTASCGEAIVVKACQGQIGVVVDQTALDAAKATSDVALATLATDAVGLVGADHAADLVDVTRNVIAGRLEAEGGAWLLSATARTAVLATATGAPVDDAYAYPLSFVPAHEPPAAARQVAADAILGYLKTQDYVHSEFGRSYLELTKVFRAQHVASLKAFRESSELMTFPTMPNVDYYVGAWLGAHTEVTIDHTTGEATSVLVELD